MRVPLRVPTLTVAVAVMLLWAAASPARVSVPLTQDVADALAGPVRAGEHVVVPKLVLDDGSTISLDLEAFEVFAPGAVIIEYTGKGPRRLAPPADRYFRGTVIGDLDSVVVLASGAKLRGFVYTRGQLYAIAPERNVYADNLPDRVARLRRVDPERDRPADMPLFHCDVDSLPAPFGEGMSATALGAPFSVQPLWTSTVYTVDLAIETDYELYTKFSSSTDAELRFIGDLTAAASAIYWRDVKSVFKIGTVHLWTTSSDPWTATTTSTALSELLSYWNSNYTSVQRTIVHMLSGKNMGGGIAYVGVLCYSSFGYGLSSSLSTTFSVTNPNLYWDILCYTHEMGHNFDSPHTECYSPAVDTCTPCDTFSCTGPVPSGGGTIMSYCHACSGGYSNIILYFGLNGQASQAVLDQIRGYIESKASCLGPLAAAPTVTGINPNVGSTTGGTSVTISGTGFQGYATVTIGGVKATGVTIVDSTTITATTGAHAAGVVNVVVQNPDSQSGTLTNGYTYGACAAPATPTLTAPAAAMSGQSYSVSWTATSSDNTYEVQESTDPGFAGASTTAVTGTSRSFSHTVASATTYYYRVRAKIVCGGSPYYSSWSSSGQTVVNPPPTGASFYTLTPCRVFDTRNENGPLGGPAITSTGRSFTVTGVCGIPASAKSIAINVTVTASDSKSWIAVFPGEIAWPGNSTVNYLAGQTRANNAVVRLASDGSGTIKVRSGTGTVHVIVDVAGYFQ